MSAIAIYMEGGGGGKGTRAALRRGMDGFLGKLKDVARAKGWRWRLVCCGGRDAAFRAFGNAYSNGSDALVVLLVDSEGTVDASPRAHLARDGWNLSGVADNQIHLMVQVMETWIVADPEALAAYYRQSFQANALPAADDLETVAKNEVASALDRATAQTQKGRYHKIHHAAALLACIDPAKARARCRHCERLFATLDAAVAAG